MPRTRQAFFEREPNQTHARLIHYTTAESTLTSSDLGVIHRLNCVRERLHSGNHESKLNSKERPARNYWEIATLGTLMLRLSSVLRLENLTCRISRCPLAAIMQQLVVLWTEFLILRIFGG